MSKTYVTGGYIGNNYTYPSGPAPTLPYVTSGLTFNLDASDSASYPGTGTTWTDTIGGLTGTLTNGPTFSSGNGGSIVFDGVNDYVSFSGNAAFNFGTGDLTIESWVYWDGTYSGGGRSIYGTGGSGSLDQFGLYNGNPFYFGGIGPNTTLNTPAANSWSHLIASRIGTTLRLYINAVETASGTQSLSIGISTSTAYVGNRAGLDCTFKSNISVVRIYKGKGLTSSEITQNFNALRVRYGI